MTNFKQLQIALIIFIAFLFIANELLAQEKDTGLLLAKSIYGECGIDCMDNEEGLIIYYVYVKASARIDKPLYETILQYSGAVKKRKNHPRKWLHHLNREGIKPRKWNNKLNWNNHKAKWIELLQKCDRLLLGATHDPYPVIIHYCGRYERSIVHPSLVEIKLGLKNIYFTNRKMIREHVKMKGIR